MIIFSLLRRLSDLVDGVSKIYLKPTKQIIFLYYTEEHYIFFQDISSFLMILLAQVLVTARESNISDISSKGSIHSINRSILVLKSLQ